MEVDSDSEQYILGYTEEQISHEACVLCLLDVNVDSTTKETAVLYLLFHVCRTTSMVEDFRITILSFR